MSKHRIHSPEFKAKVAMEAIIGRKTLQEIAADNALVPLYAAQLPVPPIQMSQGKRQLLDGASELYTKGGARRQLPRRPAQATRNLARLPCSSLGL